MPLTTLVLTNLIFEDKAYIFTKHTPKQKVEKQSGPGTSPPPLAGIVEESPPRKRERSLALLLPAKNCRPSQLLADENESLGGEDASSFSRDGEMHPPWRLNKGCLVGRRPLRGHGADCVVALVVDEPPWKVSAPSRQDHRSTPSSTLAYTAGQRMK
jgi:hypothetical protein